MSDAETIRRLIEQVDLVDHAEAIMARVQPSIRVRTSRATDQDIVVGASKLGGHPDLPPDFDWYRWHGTPLTFFAQFNLMDTAPYDVEKTLPASGMLYFFAEAYEQRWGYDPEDRGVGRVLYLPDTATLERREHPAGRINGRWVLPRPTCSVSFARELSLPPADLIADELDWPDDVTDAYIDLSDTRYERDPATATHRLLGHPDQLQNDMRVEVQMASNGLYWGDDRHVDDPRVPELEGGIDEWRLLFQLDSDELLDIEWGDTGMIYYWIRQRDLQVANFADIWLIMQTF